MRVLQANRGCVREICLEAEPADATHQFVSLLGHRGQPATRARPQVVVVHHRLFLSGFVDAVCVASYVRHKWLKHGVNGIDDAFVDVPKGFVQCAGNTADYFLLLFCGKFFVAHVVLEQVHCSPPSISIYYTAQTAFCQM